MKQFGFALSLLVAVVVLGCGENCNDCKDLASKSLLVLDSDGNNLLFGSSAVYDPQKVTLSSSGTRLGPLKINETTQTVSFFLEDTYSVYTLNFKDDSSETLVFKLAERESSLCCGTQTYAVGAQLNGMTIENTDVITIRK